MKNNRWITIAFMLLMACNLCAQSDKHLVVKHIKLDSLNIKLDTLSVIPNTFMVHNLSPNEYYIDFLAATLHVLDSSLLHKTVFLQYETFKIDFSKPRLHKTPPPIEQKRPQHQTIDYQLPFVDEVFRGNDLVTNGSITRGVSVGNNQDVALNSSLNLQIAGKLTDDIEIIASVTDKNIPIQPEGNTVNLQDINSVFITLKYKNRIQIDAGDVRFEHNTGDFYRVNKELAGIKGSVLSNFSDKALMKNVAGGGVSKGKFKRQSLVVRNGSQGPYQLSGANGEPSIAVVAGSERVFVDGKMLTRGAEYDYTIEYNTAEITFTPNMLVSSEKRIVVEFEYTDRHYVRYNLFSDNEVTFGKKVPTKLFVNFFHEQDLKNQSLQPELTNDHKRFLSQLGNDGLAAFFPLVDTARFTQNAILYSQIDTIVNNIIYTIFQFSSDSSSTLFSPSFSYLGTNKGNYKLASNSANGRVFEWIAPIDGVPQGDYEPVLALVSPTSHQLLTIGVESKLRAQTILSSEATLTNYNRNLFSKIDNENNLGFAYSLRISDAEKVKSRKDTVAWDILSDFSLQLIHKNFSPFESFRNVEFARDYNLASDFSNSATEWMLQLSMTAVKQKLHNLSYRANALLRQGESHGFRNEITTDDFFGKWHLNTKSSLLISRDSIQRTSFVTSYVNVEKSARYVVFGINNSLEYNKLDDRKTSLLRLNSFAFDELSIYMRNPDSMRHIFMVTYKNRNEFAPRQHFFAHNLTVHEARVQYKLPSHRNHSFSTNAIYRHQMFFDSLGGKKGEHYFVGNLSYNARFLRNAIVFTTYYEAGSGMEQKKSFTFLKVAKGQGTHVWNDYNGDGLEQIDEFEIAAFADEAEYVKVWITNNEYVNVFNNTLAQSLLIRPAAVWGQQTGIRRFIARFANSTNFRTTLKHRTKMFLPFLIKDDENTVANTLNLANTLSFNNANSKFAFDFTVQKTNNKQFLYYGYESNNTDLQEVTLKSTPLEQLYLQTMFQHRRNQNKSTFNSRNYSIESYNINEEIRLQFQNRYFAVLTADYAMKNNLEGNEKLNSLQLGLSFIYKWLNRGNISVSGEYVNIRGRSGDNSTVSYQMLGGFSVGQNFAWNIDSSIAVSEFLQLSLHYNGRAVSGQKVVHYGNVSISAVF